MRIDMTKSKFMTEFQDACDRATTCPFCVIAEKISFRCLQSYVTQADETGTSTVRLGEAEGFCRSHASDLKYHLCSSDRGILSIAASYEKMMGKLEDRLLGVLEESERPARKMSNWFGRREPAVYDAVTRLVQPIDSCPVCRTVQTLDVSTLWAVAEHLMTDPDESIGWLSKSCGLCLPHFCALSNEVHDETVARRLCQVELDKISDLRERLSNYIQKHGYCYQDDEFSAWEGACWTDAIDLMVGATG